MLTFNVLPRLRRLSVTTGHLRLTSNTLHPLQCCNNRLFALLLIDFGRSADQQRTTTPKHEAGKQHTSKYLQDQLHKERSARWRLYTVYVPP